MGGAGCVSIEFTLVFQFCIQSLIFHQNDKRIRVRKLTEKEGVGGPDAEFYWKYALFLQFM